ncbi:MAG: DUF3750 domain-containing protein [Burkholderiales bacterium]|nr:DUF3750 domain-containing protein [Burkholderiales bacterium]
MTLWLVAGLVLLLAGPLLALAVGKASLHGDWRTATHRSAGLAPDPAAHPEAIVQVYASRAFAWRGAFADHTWVAVKPAGADRYTRYEVIGWRGGDGRSVVSVSSQRAPDAEWFGAPPRLLRDVRGEAAQAVIARLDAVVAAYPYPATYRVWPGPNSNTFVAYLGRSIPELRLVMPSIAIGKDYVSLAHLVGPSPSHTGIAVSLYGLVGITVAWDEGLEINLLGLVTGFDVRHPALKLPGIGRVPGDG